MFETASLTDRVIKAAFELAARRPWPQITLLEIADAATVSLAELRKEFASKAAIVSAFTKAVDEEVLRAAAKRDASESPRDRIFEVIMRRLDVLGPYRSALASITRSAVPDPHSLRSYLCSQHWMLQAAGVRTAGIGGGVRLAGLAGVYAQVFRTWLNDEDPGLARTMAALDRRLRRGESWLMRVDEACQGFGHMARTLRPRVRPRPTGDAGPAAPPAPSEVM